MGTKATREQKINFMEMLLKKNSGMSKAETLKVFCRAMTCNMTTAREIWNLVK